MGGGLVDEGGGKVVDEAALDFGIETLVAFARGAGAGDVRGGN